MSFWSSDLYEFTIETGRSSISRQQLPLSGRGRLLTSNGTNKVYWDARSVHRDRLKKDTEGDELDVLVSLVESWEDEHYPMGYPEPHEAIRFRLEQAGLKSRDLVPIIGSRTKVSEMLSGKRAITMPMARALHERFGIPVEVLIR